ncbi:MAG: ribonuclease [Cyanobacteria bacterium RYN_339]|nr:ribonuclease [Cyanobacteria bacterium RYN_339]
MYAASPRRMAGWLGGNLQTFEKAWWAKGYEVVVGVDEAGRGPLAGNVVAACVLLPRRNSRKLVGLTDSKQLTPLQRDRLYDALQDVALAIGVGEATPAEIDEVNILQATFLAMRRAIAQVPQSQIVLVDGNQRIRLLELEQETIVKGDARSRSIAAASVIAKVTRDRQMVALHEELPQYGFARHKGYGTAIHYAALREHGPTVHHRRSFLL